MTVDGGRRRNMTLYLALETDGLVTQTAKTVISVCSKNVLNAVPRVQKITYEQDNKEISTIPQTDYTKLLNQVGCEACSFETYELLDLDG